jgi:hypothetical protein
MYNSKTEYHVCDYYDAMALFGETNVSIHIEIRRKGTTTWSEMTQKPSFKLKIDDDINFGKYECIENKCNVWKADKLTLNNQKFRDVEETAFKVFRDNDIIAPLARRAIVSLYKGDELLRIDNYTMIETIKNKEFIEKHWEKDTPVTLWEIENGVAECKKDYGNGTDCEIEQTNANIILDLSSKNYVNFPIFIACENIVHNWDGTCWNEGNNVWVANVSGSLYLIPGGLDLSFGCRHYDFDECSTHTDCFTNQTCSNIYTSTIDNFNSTYTLPFPDNCNSKPSMWQIIGIVIGVVVCIVGIIFILRYVHNARRGVYVPVLLKSHM